MDGTYDGRLSTLAMDFEEQMRCVNIRVLRLLEQIQVYTYFATYCLLCLCLC